MQARDSLRRAVGQSGVASEIKAKDVSEASNTSQVDSNSRLDDGSRSEGAGGNDSFVGSLIDDSTLEDVLAEEHAAPVVDISRYHGDMKTLSVAPLPHSLVWQLTKPKVSLAQKNAYLAKTFIPRVVTVAADDASDLATYILYACVLDHQSALLRSVEVASYVKEHGLTSSYPVLSEMVGRPITSRGEYVGVLKNILSRSDTLVSFLRNFKF